MTRRILTLLLVNLALGSSAFANGRLEDCKQSFYAEVRDAYNETVRQLEANNTKQGAVAATKLHTLTNRLLESLYYLEKGLKELAPKLDEAWTPVMKAMTQLNVAAGLLAAAVGERDHKDFLRSVKEYFEKTGSEWEKGERTLKDFGRQFNLMCDTCR
jgi:hypothetical protein